MEYRSSLERPLVSPYSQQSKLAAYRSISAHGAAAGDPHSLVLVVIDATLSRLTAASACIERGDITRKASLLHSCVVLITELRGSLNTEHGGSLAQNLSDLYGYMMGRLIHANLNSDREAVREVAGLLADLRGAWAAIGPEIRREETRSQPAASAA